MTRFTVWLLITVVMVMTLTMPSYEEENRDDWIDPNDMLNFDPSTNTMRKNKLKFEDIKRQTPPSSLSGTSDTVEEETDIPADSSEDLGSRPTGKPCGNQVDLNHPPWTQVDMDCPPSTQDDMDCPPCPRVEEPVQSCPEAGTCPPCECEPLKECVCEQPALTILRKYVRNVLNHIGDQKPIGDKEDFTFHMSLSYDNIIVMEKFVDKGNVKHVHDVHDILGDMIVRVAASQNTKMEKFALWLEHKIGLKLDRLIQFMILAALASVVLLIEIRLQIAWRRRVGQLIVLMFVISIPWTWYDLYKQAEIQQQSKVMKIPKECEDGDSWFNSLTAMVSLKKDKCYEYHEHLFIDPIIKVPPTKAIAVTFVRFWVAPLKDIGTGLSEFIRALLVDLPLTLYPVAIAIVALFLFMFLFMWFGYSIRLPFFLSIEPGPRHAIADAQIQQAIQDNTLNTKDQLERIQSLMAETEQQISDRLLRMEKQQQAALEYNMSMDYGTPVKSPSLPSAELIIKTNDVKMKTTPSLPVTEIRATSYPASSENHCRAKVQLDRGDPDNLGNKSLAKDKSENINHCDNIKTDGTALE